MSEAGISRRAMIGRIGGGAALVWTAPALFSVSRAAAATPACGTDDWTCDDEFVVCGEGPDGSVCLCDVTVEGVGFCWNDISCSGSAACQSSADCPPGWACFTSCCGTSCLPPCGTIAGEAGPQGEARASGLVKKVLDAAQRQVNLPVGARGSSG